MTDILNPLSPRNPSQQLHQDSSKGNPQHINKQQEEQTSEGYEKVMLPSRGLFYFGDAHHLEYIAIRPFDYTDEDILTTPSFFENGTVYTEILNNTILDKLYLKAKDLVPIDRDTLLIWLRSTSFGNTFEVEYECSNCHCGSGDGEKGKGGVMTWDLGKLELPEYPQDIYEELFEKGEVKITTPAKGINVTIVVPSIGKQESLEKKFSLKKDKEKIKKDFFASITLLSVISSVELENGQQERDKNRIDQYFRKIHLPLTDSRFILSKARDLNLRYNTKQTFTCADCGHIEEGVEMPILHRNFFWPVAD